MASVKMKDMKDMKVFFEFDKKTDLIKNEMISQKSFISFITFTEWFRIPAVIHVKQE